MMDLQGGVEVARISLWAWKIEDLNSTKQADRICNEDGSYDLVDYGRLPCLDIAYGEKNPFVAGDTMGPVLLTLAKAFLNGMGMGVEHVDVGIGKGLGVEYEEFSDDGAGKEKYERRKGRSDCVNPFLGKCSKEGVLGKGKQTPKEGGKGPVKGDGKGKVKGGRKETVKCKVVKNKRKKSQGITIILRT